MPTPSEKLPRAPDNARWRQGRSDIQWARVRSCRIPWVLALPLLACSDVATLGIVTVETETTVGTGDDDDWTAGPDALDLPSDDPLEQCIARGDEAGVGLCQNAAPAETFEASIE